MASIPASSITAPVPHEENRAGSVQSAPLVPQVAAAVRALNDAGYPGANREVTYSVDPASRRPVIRVIDSSTKEVITQWPEPYVLELAAEAKAQQADGQEGSGAAINEAIGD